VTATGESERDERIVVGMFASVGAFLMFTIMNVFAKYLSENHSVVEIAFYRNIFACMPFLLFALLFKRRDLFVIRSKPRMVVFRAFLGSITLVITFAAYSLMPMAETAVLLFTASLFVPVLGVLLLHERVGPYRWSAVIIGFVGVAIMVNPSGDMNLLGVAIALAAALLQAFMSIILRHLGSHEAPETVAFYLFVFGALFTGLALPFVGKGFTFDELPYFVGIGLAGTGAQWLYSIAMKHTPAAIVAVFNYTSLIWAMLFGWLIWQEWPMPIVFIGATVVIVSNALIAWRESRLYRAQRLSQSNGTP
jgi:drug/metabolite transporter (DMT)-like permease